jgi:hypothetical protein
MGVWGYGDTGFGGLGILDMGFGITIAPIYGLNYPNHFSPLCSTIQTNIISKIFLPNHTIRKVSKQPSKGS